MYVVDLSAIAAHCYTTIASSPIALFFRGPRGLEFLNGQAWGEHIKISTLSRRWSTLYLKPQLKLKILIDVIDALRKKNPIILVQSRGYTNMCVYLYLNLNRQIKNLILVELAIYAL
jgi:hypothetical protein